MRYDGILGIMPLPKKKKQGGIWLCEHIANDTLIFLSPRRACMDHSIIVKFAL
jgi:hypothetical protein